MWHVDVNPSLKCRVGSRRVSLRQLNRSDDRVPKESGASLSFGSFWPMEKRPKELPGPDLVDAITRLFYHRGYEGRDLNAP